MIVVDDREPKGIKKLFRIVRRLSRGDFQILVDDTKLVVERKTISDFWNSLKSGRLNEQLSHSDILIVEYLYIPKKIDWERVYDTINGVSVHHPVLLSRNALHTKKILLRLEEKLREGTFGVMRVRTVDRTLTDPRLGVLMKLPGIGEDRAKKVLQHYGSLWKAIGEYTQWDNIKGIGPKTVNTLIIFFQNSAPVE